MTTISSLLSAGLGWTIMGIYDDEHDQCVVFGTEEMTTLSVDVRHEVEHFLDGDFQPQVERRNPKPITTVKLSFGHLHIAVGDTYLEALAKLLQFWQPDNAKTLSLPLPDEQ